MAKKSSVAHMVCLTHPSRPAVTKCTTCFKPLCSECAREAYGTTFCSQECADNYTESREGVNQYETSRKRARRKGLVRKLIMLIIVAAIAGGAYVYLRRDPDKMNELRNRAGQLAEKGKELGGAVDPVARVALGRELDSFQEALAAGRFNQCAPFFAPNATYQAMDAARPQSPSAFIALLQSQAGTDLQFRKEGGWEKVTGKDSTFRTVVDMVLIHSGTGGPLTFTIRVGFVYTKVDGAWKITHVRQLSDFLKRGN